MSKSVENKVLALEGREKELDDMFQHGSMKKMGRKTDLEAKRLENGDLNEAEKNEDENC